MRVGEITNNEPFDPGSYISTVNNRIMPPTGSGVSTPFYSGYQGGSGADFDQAYEALTPNSIQGGGQAWTVRTGDTLQNIAAAVWGDSSLWYLIAEANGLTSGSLLSPGQLLVVPAKVANFHNTSDTFRPYDPNKALGDVNPNQPAPPKKPGGCGVVGTIIAAVIAIVVVAIVAPYAAAALANTFGGATLAAGATVGGVTAGTSATALAAGAVSTSALAGGIAAGTVSVGAGLGFAAGAIAGAAAAIVSQSFLIATGAQDRLDWKGIGMSALSGGIGGGLKELKGIGDLLKAVPGGSIAQNAALGAAGNAVTQGIAVATGLQHKFDWTQVAVSAVSAGIGSAVGSQLDGGMLSNLISGLASGAGGAATLSLLNGSDFGDNMLAMLPQIIGQTVGNAIGGNINSMIAEGAAPSGDGMDYSGGYEVDRDGVPIDDNLEGYRYIQSRGEFVGGAARSQPSWGQRFLRNPLGTLWDSGKRLVSNVFSGPSGRSQPAGRVPGASNINYTQQTGPDWLPGVDVLAKWWGGLRSGMNEVAQRYIVQPLADLNNRPKGGIGAYFGDTGFRPGNGVNTPQELYRQQQILAADRMERDPLHQIYVDVKADPIGATNDMVIGTLKGVGRVGQDLLNLGLQGASSNPTNRLGMMMTANAINDWTGQDIFQIGPYGVETTRADWLKPSNRMQYKFGYVGEFGANVAGGALVELSVASKVNSLRPFIGATEGLGTTEIGAGKIVSSELPGRFTMAEFGEAVTASELASKSYARLQSSGFDLHFVSNADNLAGQTLTSGRVEINLLRNATVDEAVATLVHESAHVDMLTRTGNLYGTRGVGEYMARAREFLFTSGRRPTAIERRQMINEIRDLGYEHR